MNPLTLIENACLLVGRFLLGLYFIVPGISKIADYEGTAAYMAEHSVPLIGVLLPLTILMQIGLGATLIAGFKGQVAAFLLAGLTLMINLFMHNFWAMEEGLQQRHEMQNFIKNLAIMAGLLFVAGTGSGPP